MIPRLSKRPEVVIIRLKSGPSLKIITGMEVGIKESIPKGKMPSGTSRDRHLEGRLAKLPEYLCHFALATTSFDGR